MSAADEVTRRTHIVAGRYQIMAMSRQLLPFERPTVVWQVVSHKFLRPLVPFAMAAAALTNTLALLPSRRHEQARRPGLFALPRRHAGFAFGCQVVFYGLALTGDRLGEGKLAKIAYLPKFLVDSNWAAVVGLGRFVTRRQSTLWQRVQRRGE